MENTLNVFNLYITNKAQKIVKSFFIYNFVGQYSLPYRKIADIYVILYGL